MPIYIDMANTRARGWCFTLPNYDDNSISQICETNIYDYLIIGKEIAPTTGTPHLQGFIYCKNKISFNALKPALGNAHIEQARGSIDDNIRYCSKEGDSREWGIRPAGQGHRTDLENFRDAILNGMSEEDLIQNFCGCMAKYDRFYQRCRNIVLKKEAAKREPVEVIVLHGDAGVGKTRHVYDNEEPTDIYKLEVGDGSSGSVFWDNYNGESIVLIDDFHSNLKFDYFLRLLDRYPMKLNIKGSYTWKCAKKIYITSNIPPQEWYHSIENPVLRRALWRRITTVLKIE